jgi:hypothetical protein
MEIFRPGEIAIKENTNCGCGWVPALEALLAM